MRRTDDAEVPTIDRRDLRDLQALCRRDDGGVHRPERKVAVAPDQLGDAQPVRRGHGLDGERPARKVPEKADLRDRAEPSGQEVGDLGDDQGGDEQRTGMGLEQLEARGVVRVVSVDVGVQRPGVDDQRGYEATSAAKISSMRSETSLRPLRPAPAAPRRRREDGAPR